MVPHDPESSALPGSLAAPVEAAPCLAPTSQKSFLDQHGRLLALALAAGLVAGVASLLAGEVILNRYQSDLLPTLKLRPSAEDMRRWRSARLYSATLTFTTMGGFLGLAMGLAGGLARCSVLASVRAAILGLLLGAAAVGLMALVLVSIFFQRHDPQSGDLVLPLLTHGAIWSAVGAIGGLAFGLGLAGRGRWKATLVGGLVGAAAATIVYEIVGALAFASDKTDLPVSSSITTRAMAQLLVAILSAVGAVLALRQSAKREASSPAPS
jgi:vacuolar-type H+-ATPase subunit I/STV1